jgi:putative Mn2+ efflux pump MntP
MVNPLFPARADNAYRGSKNALWLFALLLLMTVGIALNSIFNGYTVASFADGIPLDTFTAAGARTVVALFAIFGLSRLLLGLLGILVLARYRTLIPCLFALFLLEHLGGRLILHFLPVARTGKPAGPAVNLVLLVLMIAGLVLSLLRCSKEEA